MTERERGTRTRSPRTEDLWRRAKQVPRPTHEAGVEMLKTAGRKYLDDRRELGLDDPSRVPPGEFWTSKYNV